MDRPIDKCPKCGKVLKLTRHHIFPKRFFKHKGKPKFSYLCRKCHDQLETVIYDAEYNKKTRKRKNLGRKWYEDIWSKFTSSKKLEDVEW